MLYYGNLNCCPAQKRREVSQLILIVGKNVGKMCALSIKSGEEVPASRTLVMIWGGGPIANPGLTQVRSQVLALTLLHGPGETHRTGYKSWLGFKSSLTHG